MPYEYGLIGIVAIFLAIAQVFVDGGFMNALIQKQDRSELDYSTVFYTSFILSISIYSILFLISPFIASFYKVPILTEIIRVLGLIVIINSLAIVYRTKLSISMDFKVQAKLSVISVLISGFVGVYLAYHGQGVWALVFQSITLYACNTLFLYLNLRWLPKFNFSRKSFNSLFGFGSKLLAAGLVQAIYSNAYSVLIGRFFSMKELGLYSKSSQFTLYPASMMTNMLQRVLYPYLVKYQNDNIKLFELNKQYYTIMAMIFFPLFIGLSVLAEPFVVLLLSKNWVDSVPLIRILALTFLIYPFINVNMFIFQVKGMSSRFLLIEILTKVSGILILVLTLKYSIFILCAGLFLQHLLHLCISSYYSDKAMQSKVFSQLKILLPITVASTIIAIAVFTTIQNFNKPALQLLIGILLLTISYVIYYYLFMKNLTVAIIKQIFT